MNPAFHSFSCSRPQLALLLCGIMAGGVLFGQATESRVWTDIQGRTVRATLVGMAGGQVTLKLENGAQSSIAVTTLSAQDQAYVKSINESPASAQPSAGAVATSPSGQAAWPKEIIAVDPKSIVVTPGLQDEKERQYHYLSGSFEFIAFAPLTGTVMTAVAADFELLRTAVTRLPWGWEPKPKEGPRFSIYLTETDADYIRMGGEETSAGFTKDGKSYLRFSALGLKKVGGRYAFDARQKDPGRVLGLTLREMNWDKRALMYPWASSGLENLIQRVTYQDNGTIRFTALESSIKKAVKDRSTKEVQPDVARMLRRLKEPWGSNRGDSVQFLLEDHLDSMMLVYYFGFLDGDGSGTGLHTYFREIGEAAAKRDYRDSKEKGAELMNKFLTGRSDAQLTAEIPEKFRAAGIKF
jgi:hypothetical protein